MYKNFPFEATQSIIQRLNVFVIWSSFFSVNSCYSRAYALSRKVTGVHRGWEETRFSRGAEEFRSVHQEQIPQKAGAGAYEFLNEIYQPVDAARNFPSRTLNNCELFM